MTKRLDKDSNRELLALMDLVAAAGDFAEGITDTIIEGDHLTQDQINELNEEIQSLVEYARNIVKFIAPYTD